MDEVVGSPPRVAALSSPGMVALCATRPFDVAPSTMGFAQGALVRRVWRGRRSRDWRRRRRRRRGRRCVRRRKFATLATSRRSAGHGVDESQPVVAHCTRWFCEKQQQPDIHTECGGSQCASAQYRQSGMVLRRFGPQQFAHLRQRGCQRHLYVGGYLSEPGRVCQSASARLTGGGCDGHDVGRKGGEGAADIDQGERGGGGGVVNKGRNGEGGGGWRKHRDQGG